MWRCLTQLAQRPTLRTKASGIRIRDSRVRQGIAPTGASAAVAATANNEGPIVATNSLRFTLTKSSNILEYCAVCYIPVPWTSGTVFRTPGALHML